VGGRIVAGPHVRNACRRHLADLKHGKARGLRFDVELAERKIKQFPDVYRLSEGQFDGRPFNLEPAQQFIVGSVFGWLSDRRVPGTWVRRFRRAFVEMGKGNGKSPLAGGIALDGLAMQGEAGAQIYAAAAKREQAGILFADAVKMVKQSPSLRRRLALSGTEGKEYNIAHHPTGSFFRPVSRDTGKTGSGPRPYFILADEIHEMPDRRIIDMLERGFKFRRDPLLFMITNSGSDPNSVAGQEHDLAVRVAAGSPEPVGPDGTWVGEIIDDDLFSYVCALDKGDDPLRDPSCWEKANPLLGVTITREYLAGLVRDAANLPSARNEILRLHFCVWTEADVAWLTRELIDPALSDFDPGEHAGKGAVCGLDLSQRRDLTVKATIVRTGSVLCAARRANADGSPPDDLEDGEEERFVSKPTFDAWIEAWTPGDTLKARSIRDKLHYDVWAEQGWLYAPPGAIVPYLQVAQGVAEDAAEFDLRLVAYDRYAFRSFETEADQLGLQVQYVEHPQGGLKKGKVTDEMKRVARQADPPREAEGLWMPGSVLAFEEALLEGRLRLRRNPVLISALLSAATETDKWGNRWLTKARSVNKIDAAVALCMALGAAIAVLGDDEGN
jgi:phage terminase large subunit-like protein